MDTTLCEFNYCIYNESDIHDCNRNLNYYRDIVYSTNYNTDINNFKIILIFIQIYIIHFIFLYIHVLYRNKKKYNIGCQTETDTHYTVNEFIVINNESVKEKQDNNSDANKINDFLHKLKKTYILSLSNIQNLTDSIRFEKGVQIYTDDCINSNINIISSTILNDTLIYNIKINTYDCIIHIHKDEIKTICNCPDYIYRMKYDNNMTCKHCTAFLLKLYNGKGTSCQSA